MNELPLVKEMKWILIKDKVPPFDTAVVLLGYQWVENIYCKPTHFKIMKMCLAYNECYGETVMTAIDDLHEGIPPDIDFEPVWWHPLDDFPKELHELLGPPPTSRGVP